MTRRAEETQRNARHNVQVIVFGLESRRPPSLFEAIRVCEVFRRRLLGVAARFFGSDRIPPKFSGKAAGGGPLSDDHQHLHVFALALKGHGAPSAERFVDRVGVVCRAGLSPPEVELVCAVTLPALKAASATQPGSALGSGPVRGGRGSGRRRRRGITRGAGGSLIRRAQRLTTRWVSAESLRDLNGSKRSPCFSGAEVSGSSSTATSFGHG